MIYKFDMPDQSTLDELTKNLGKVINITKDYTWNNKLISSQLLQGIQAGESIPKLAARMQNVSTINASAAVRNARTMTTNAENKGRLSSYNKAAEDGVVMQKEWMATGDDRTRDWHLEIDGEAIDIDDVWKNAAGEIAYPGDPDASAQNVWNCRCSMRSRVKGFKTASGKINKITYTSTSTSSHAESIAAEKARRASTITITESEKSVINKYVESGNKIDGDISDSLASIINNKGTVNGNVILYRKISTEELGFDRRTLIKALRNNNESVYGSLIGKRITPGGFVSTAKTVSGTAGFDGPLTLTIENVSGTNGLDLASLSVKANEQEVLFDKGTSYVIKSITPEFDADGDYMSTRILVNIVGKK